MVSSGYGESFLLLMRVLSPFGCSRCCGAVAVGVVTVVVLLLLRGKRRHDSSSAMGQPVCILYSRCIRDKFFSHVELCRPL